MADKIDPDEIARETGLDVEDVRQVLAYLVPSWIFARYIDDDLDGVDYHRLREDE